MLTPRATRRSKPTGVPSAPCRNHAPTRNEEGSYIRSERSERSNEQPSLTKNNIA
nr:MAG TPA: hypothetical protein [Caudoviricetes sp.]